MWFGSGSFYFHQGEDAPFFGIHWAGPLVSSFFQQAFGHVWFSTRWWCVDVLVQNDMFLSLIVDWRIVMVGLLLNRLSRDAFRRFMMHLDAPGSCSMTGSVFSQCELLRVNFPSSTAMRGFSTCIDSTILCLDSKCQCFHDAVMHVGCFSNTDWEDSFLCLWMGMVIFIFIANWKGHVLTWIHSDMTCVSSTFWRIRDAVQS